MEDIHIRDATADNLGDLCRICVPPEKRDDPTFTKGVEEKRKWAVGMLRAWGTFAKVAYQGSTPAGQIQYKPDPAHRVVYIYCIYVPAPEYWRQGIASLLLDHLVEDMQCPHIWFDRQLPLALVTKTFPGETPGQYSARSFFTRKGFRPVGEDTDWLYYPLADGVTLAPETETEIVEGFFLEEQKVEYVPQVEDKGKAVILYRPSFCPFSYPFFKRAEGYIREVAPETPIRWISQSDAPAEVEKRGGFVGCIVNAHPIKAFILDKDRFQKEVRESLRTVSG